MQVHEDASYASDSETLYSHVEVDSIGDPEPTTAVVMSVQSRANTESGFTLMSQDFQSQYFLYYGTTNVPVAVTALTGENAGQSRTGWITSVFTHQSSVQPVWFDFATADKCRSMALYTRLISARDLSPTLIIMGSIVRDGVCPRNTEYNRAEDSRAHRQ